MAFLKLLVTAPLLLSLAPAPDVLMPGHRAIQHRLVLEWDAEQHGERFFAHPTAGFGDQIEIEPEVPFRFSSKYGTRIYAVPDGEPFVSADRDGPDPSWAVGEIPVGQVDSVPIGSTLVSIETRLRVASVAEGRIELVEVGEQRTRAIWPYLAVVAVGLVVIGGLVIRRKRRHREG